MVWGQEVTFQSDFAGNIAFNSQQVISLAEAIPQDLYDWAPSDGVRSVSQAIMHIASANYFLSTLMGGEIPEGVDPMSMETITDKEIVIEELKKSYQFLSETGQSVQDETMNDMINFPPIGQDLSRRSFMLIAVGHCWEHLGQLIAYARSNEIVPPWSQ